MHTTPKLLAAAIALPLAFAMTLPANAAPNSGYQNYSNVRGAAPATIRVAVRTADRRDARAERQIENQLGALTRDIRQANRAGELTRYEARLFGQKLQTLERSYAALARNGLSRGEIRLTLNRIDSVNGQLTAARNNFAQRTRHSDRRVAQRAIGRAVTRH